jgi:hypothetical protein
VESCLIVQGENFNVDLKLETSVNASDVVDSFVDEGGAVICMFLLTAAVRKPFTCFPNYFWASIKKFVILSRIYWSSSVHIWFICISNSKLWT